MEPVTNIASENARTWIDIIQYEGVIVVLFLISLVLVVFSFFSLISFIQKQITTLKDRKANSKAKEILAQAEKLAKEIIVDASVQADNKRVLFEEEYTDALKEDKQAIKQFLDTYRLDLEKSITETSRMINEKNLLATESFSGSLNSIEQHVVQNADNAKESLNLFVNKSEEIINRLNHEIENVEGGIQQLSATLSHVAENKIDENTKIIQSELKRISNETASSIETVAKSMNETLQSTMDQEIKAVRQELENYQKLRRQMVDEKILTLVEETAQIALQKELSMQNQAELVYRSLEEAKQKGVFS